MGQFLQKNAWAILTVLATLWGGYLTGTATMRLTVEGLVARVAALESLTKENEERVCRIEALSETGKCKR